MSKGNNSAQEGGHYLKTEDKSRREREKKRGSLWFDLKISVKKFKPVRKGVGKNITMGERGNTTLLGEKTSCKDALLRKEGGGGGKSN